MAALDLKTYKDIQDAVLEELKIPQTDTTTLNRIKRDINILYRDLASRKRWDWLRKFITVLHRKYINAGTASVTLDSTAVTLTDAPSISVKGYWIKFDATEEIYRVAQHTAGSTSLTLQSSYPQPTNSETGYKLWTDRVPLPTDCVETIEVGHQWVKQPMENVGRQKMRRMIARYPQTEGFPHSYSTNDYKDPNPYSTSLPATASRSSSGLVKTVVFASDVSATLEAGDKFELANMGDLSYNGQWIASTVSSATVTYTALVPLSEVSTVDTSGTGGKLGTKTAEETYRELWVYPSLYQDNDITLHVDYIQSIQPLEDDTDEPLMPLEDRVILKYMTLMQQWVKHRNPELYSKNEQWYKEKFISMAAKAGDSSDNPNIFSDPQWVGRKRYRRYQTKYRY